MWIASTQADVNVAVAGEALPASAAGPVAFYTGTNLLNPDGTAAETLLDVFKANTAPIETEPGRYPHEVKFDGGRLFPVPGAEPVPLAAVTWTEIVSHSSSTVVSEAEGEPLLILEQYDVEGEIESGRMVIDRELYAWDIAPDGRVTERGPLAGEPEPRVERRRAE